MAAKPKKQQKVDIKYAIDKQVYDEFAKMCSKKGFAPQVVVERMMSKYNESGQF